MDSAFAAYTDKNGITGSEAIAAMFAGSYKLSDHFSLLAKLGVVSNAPPAGAASASSFVNPVIGSTYSTYLAEDFRLSVFLGMTLPVGMGSGNTPDPAVQAANSAGILARSAMDNAMFAVNYLTVIPGVDLAYVAHNLTLQYEATFFQLNRVQGEGVDKDPERTNFTTGFSTGYAFLPWVSASGEIRYQRWLVNPTVFNAPSPAPENLSFAVGPRFTFKIGNSTARPGIAYAQGLLGPIAAPGFTSNTNSDKIFFIDLPISF